tara:strand:- start:37 stop:264 length:228 start_codon:yes stop_codon:yes gene_type:complete
MNKIRIEGIEGYYYVNNNHLIYNVNYNEDNQVDDIDDVQVTDLTELKVYQYNELAKKLWVYYPNYNINKLKGKFI